MYPFEPPTTPPPVTADVYPPPAAADVEEPTVRVGDVVTVTYWDTARLADVVRVGLVVDVAPAGARVAYLTEISDPIPLDAPVVDGAPPAVRVAPVET